MALVIRWIWPGSHRQAAKTVATFADRTESEEDSDADGYEEVDEKKNAALKKKAAPPPKRAAPPVKAPPRPSPSKPPPKSEEPEEFADRESGAESDVDDVDYEEVSDVSKPQPAPRKSRIK